MSIYHQPKGSIVLKAIIVILIGVLIYVLYEPFKIREQENAYKKESRARMINIRLAQLQYISEYGIYASSMDTLIAFVNKNLESGVSSKENFKPLTFSEFVAESLLHSPKSLSPYRLTSIDTTIIKKYLLECPDGYGQIGSLTDESRINKADWE